MRQMLLLWTLCRLAQGAVLFYVWKIHNTYRPAREWALGALIAAPGLLLVGLGDIAPDWASVAGANAFLLTGWMVFDFGVMRAAGRRPPWRFGAGLVLAAVGATAYFSLVAPDYSTRSMVHNATVIVLDALAAASCLASRSPALGTTLRLLAGVYGVHIASCLWRCFGDASGPAPAPLAPALSQIQYGYVSIASTVVVTTLLVLLTSQELQAKLRDMARHDPLTRVCNRRTLEEVVTCRWPEAVRNDESLACLMLDIDHFKRFNDSFGHQAGDAALVAVSETARRMLRGDDTWCRYGGEEFLALLPRVEAGEAVRVAERLRRRIGALSLDGRTITVSIGVAAATASSVHWTELVGRCDQALYRAKENGRNRVELAEAAPEEAGGAVRLVWRDAYACGHMAIDAQHRALFDAANALLASLLAGAAKPVCRRRIKTLLGEVERHFQDEEAIFTAAGYPEAELHRAIHRQLRERADALLDKYERDALPLGELLDFIATDMVSRHMLAEDRKFFPFLKTV